MLPEFPPNLRTMPRSLVFVRALEAFEGEILSEYRAETGSGIYLEKWCAIDRGITRSLFVRTERRAIAEFLGGRLSMLELLTSSSDGVGILVDKRGNETVAVFRVLLSDLPADYLPTAAAFHDESLRPRWETVPQNFLLDTTWDAKLLASIEREYLNVFNFAYFTQPGLNRTFPPGVLDYDYDGGFPLMHVYNRLRKSVPPQYRAKSVSVSANSPGVLTIDAPVSTADHLASALRAVRRSANVYETLHSWSRMKPAFANLNTIPTTARTHVNALCTALGVDVNAILPTTVTQVPEPMQVLVAGKLIASYYRRLYRLLEPTLGVEFVSVRVEGPQANAPIGVFEEDGDDEDAL